VECPKCKHEQEEGNYECLNCGIVFFKYKRAQKRQWQHSMPKDVGLIWQMPERNHPLYRMGRFLLLIGLAYLSWKLIFSPIDFWQGNAASQSFLHNINLPFHEAGHLIFRPLGAFMHSLGGSLGQLLMPAVCFGVLLWKTRDAFGAAVALWWVGENFLDLVSYINDAGSLTMPLLGGNEGLTSPYGFHDWEFILTETGLLGVHEGLAQSAHILGSLLMLLGMGWMLALLLYKR